MRGKIKTTLWLSLMLVMIGAMMPSLGRSVPTTNTTVYVDPSEVSGILPSDPDPYFTVNIMVENAKDLWSISFDVDYTPYAKTIIGVEVTQGTFLEDPDPDGFKIFWARPEPRIDTFRGLIHIGYARLAESKNPFIGHLDPVGVDGNGLLATIRFKVVSAGNSPIDVTNLILHDSTGAEVGARAVNGAYYGPTANLIRGHLVRRDMLVGETQSFYTKVKNTGDVPLEVRTHWDMYRVEDLQRLQIYSGQSYSGFGPVEYTYLYANEYSEWLEWGWTNPGASVIGEPDGNYAETNHYCSITSLYGFEDLDLGNRIISNVIIEGYTQYPNGLDMDNDLDTYSFTTSTAWAWTGSLWGDSDWGWHAIRWVDSSSDRCPALLNVTELNSLQVLIHYWTADGEDHGPGRIDALRLRVEFSKFAPLYPESYVIQPGQVLELPQSTWTLKTYDVGKWITTLVCEYRYTWTDEYGYHTTAWIPSEKVKTLTWWVTEG